MKSARGLLGWQVAGCEPPQLSNAPACCTLCPRRRAGLQRCPPAWEVVCRGCHRSAPCSLPWSPRRDLSPLPASPVLQGDPFRGFGLVWRESESMIPPSWCVLGCVSILLPNALQVLPNRVLQPGPLSSERLLLQSALCIEAKSFSPKQLRL